MAFRQLGKKLVMLKYF